MTQKFTLITTTTTGNKIQHFTNIRDWFIAFMQRELKVNSLGYLELLETDKTITLNLHDKATNQLILTLYHNSDITKGYILTNGLYYFNQQDVVEDKKAKSKNKLAYQFGMPLAELKELYFDYTIFRYFFDEVSNLDSMQINLPDGPFFGSTHSPTAAVLVGAGLLDHRFFLTDLALSHFSPWV